VDRARDEDLRVLALARRHRGLGHTSVPKKPAEIETSEA
jgi:hypothetical protein